MNRISNLVESLSPSQTLVMSQKSRELRAAGIDVINLSVGEPDFNTPDHIKEAARRAIDENHSFYTPVAGYLSLREAIVMDLARHPGLQHYDPSQIVVSNGAKQSLCNAMLATLNPGDEVVIPVPAWVSYVEMVKLTGARAVTVMADIERDFKITPADLESAITDKTRMVILNSPSNPTGSVYSRDELQAIVSVLAHHPRVLLLSDEIYEHINFTGSFTSLASFPEIADRVILVNGVSKAYAMTGWRIGYMAAPPDIAAACTKLQSQCTSNPSSIAQKAAEAAYLGPQECVMERCRAFERRRDLVVRLASSIPGLKINRPQGAFYLFPEVSSCFGMTDPVSGTHIGNSGDLAMYLLEQGHVATVDGAAFCAPGYLHLSYATSDDNIREALGRIERAIGRLK